LLLPLSLPRLLSLLRLLLLSELRLGSLRGASLGALGALGALGGGLGGLSVLGLSGFRSSWAFEIVTAETPTKITDAKVNSASPALANFDFISLPPYAHSTSNSAKG